MPSPFKLINYLGTAAILLLALSINRSSAAELEKQLSKVDAYNKLTNLVDGNEALKSGTDKFQTYLQNKKNPTSSTPSEEAKLIYEQNIDAKPCSHCPKYLNLTLAVNKIVEKVKSDENISESNEALIQLNKLKFLYYVVRSENDKGEINCSKLGDNYFNPSKLDGKFKMLSETMIKMPEVTDMQYIPKGKEEIYYYYRGEGEKSNVVIEVLMNKDGTARMRYYDFDSQLDRFHNKLPSMGLAEKTDISKPQGEKTGNYMDLDFDIKTRNTAIPTDINFLKAGASTQIAEDINLKLKNQINFNEQTASVALESDKGDKYLVLEGKNITDGGKSVSTIIPMEINLDESSKMRVTGSLENQISVADMTKMKISEVQNNQIVTLGLTDHNHEYFNIKAKTDQQGLENYSVSSKYSLGDSSSVAASYEEGRDGKKAYMVSNVTSFGKHETLTTSYGTSGDSRRGFVQTQYENKIGKSTSLIIGAKVGDDKSFSLVYQTKF